MAATLTSTDLLNASEYMTHRYRLRFIALWRERFPHIGLDYTIRYARDQDYTVPSSLRNSRAVVVDVKFSRRGCEAMSCYPYTATGVVNVHTPIGGYTQTSRTTIQYNQPACFNLDPAVSWRDGEIQSVDLNYSADGRCVMVDTMTKMYFNTPYLRTDEHVVRGVDDVPGFDVRHDSRAAFPDRIVGTFNDAYCRRFGRQVANNRCSLAWYEALTTFILGDMIYCTFKMMTNGALAHISSFDYERPSDILPAPPQPGGEAMLDEWLRYRDSTVDVNRERLMSINPTIVGLTPYNMLVYRAEEGFSSIAYRTDYWRRQDVGGNGFDDMLKERQRVLHARPKTNTEPHALLQGWARERRTGRSDDYDDRLEQIIADFLEDHALIMGILTDLGFNYLESLVTDLLRQLNNIIIPALRRVLQGQSRRVTVALLGETYKAVLVQSLNRALIRTVSTMARLTVRTVSAALSLANVALTFLTIADLVLMFWDPYGYSNMFPAGYLDDLSNSFLGAMYDSVGNQSRDVIEYLPEYYSHFIEDDEAMSQMILDVMDYIGALEHNSNGQILTLNDDDEISDFDEGALTAVAFAANDTFAYFKWYCARHFDVLHKTKPARGIHVGAATLVFAAAISVAAGVWFASHVLVVLSIVLVTLAILLYSSDAITYFQIIKNKQ